MVEPSSHPSTLRRILPYGVAAVFTLLAALGIRAYMANAGAPARTTRVTPLPVSEDEAITDVVLAPDASFLVYRRESDSIAPRLWLKRWDGSASAAIPGTEQAQRPRVSPRGDEVVFQHGGDGSIRVASLTGGPPRTLVDSAWCCPTWETDGFVYFTQAGSHSIGRVPASGGAAEQVTRLGDGETGHYLLRLLPGGRSGVVTVGGVGTFEVSSVRLATGELEPLAYGTEARHTASGHLLWLAPGARTLVGAPFDLRAGVPTALATPVLTVSIASMFDLAQNGTAIYQPPPLLVDGEEVVWADRTGYVVGVDEGWVVRSPGNVESVATSPDGTKLAFAIFDGERTDIWIKDLTDSGYFDLTSDGEANRRVSWTADGRSVVFVREDQGVQGIWSVPADTSGARELLVTAEALRADRIHDLVGAPGGWLVYVTGHGRGDLDLHAIRPGIDPAPRALLTGEFDAAAPSVSPDGRWLAYASDETGRVEVYVSPFPDVADGKWQVSTAGGSAPLWGRDGRELFYHDPTLGMVAVDVATSRGFSAGPPRLLFALSVTPFVSPADRRLYDVTPDRRSFVMVRSAWDPTPRIVLARDWFDELEEKARAGTKEGRRVGR
ncbi:MAG TPA: hypothetical protein VGA22_03105 [Gemmatimonadales bacterium]